MSIDWSLNLNRRAYAIWLALENGETVTPGGNAAHVRAIKSLIKADVCKIDNGIVTIKPTIDYAADNGSCNRSADDITPDGAGEMAADDAVTVAPVDGDYDWRADGNAYTRSMVIYPSPRILHDAWELKVDAMRRFGRFAPITLVFWAAFDRLFAYRLAV